MPRWVRFLVLLALLVMLGWVAWVVFDFPPPRLLLRYGFPPAGGPTGRHRDIEGLTYIELSAGYFRMGSHHLCERGDLLGLVDSVLGTDWGTRPEHNGTECPTRWVEIAEPFWIATTEITNRVFEDEIYDHERCAYSSEDDQPAVRVSWWSARRYCRKISEWSDFVLRLPTEEEWEYACRAGTDTEYFFGDAPDTMCEHTHHETENGSDPWDSEQKPLIVGGRKPNPWGLIDMVGNVWEWCENDGPTSNVRIFRGGGCRSGSNDCRSATRRWTVPGRRIAFLGFRPVMTLPEKP